MILEGKGLVKTFGGLVAVNNLDISVKTGEIVGLIGPNGAGKSTVVNLLSGTMSATSGQVFLNGRDITRAPVHQRSRMGVVRTFQLNSVWRDMSVLQCLESAYYCQQPTNRLWRSLVVDSGIGDWRTRATDILDKMGLGVLKEQKMADLTVGHQRMAAIAAAIMINPGILLLDEPVSGMNWEESVKLLDTILDYTRSNNTGVLLIEHNVQAVKRFASRLLVMSFGKKLEEGTVEDIVNSKTVIEAYLGHEN